MRLLLRATSHRRSSSGQTEIAASPDTPHRERWQWDLRLLDTPAPVESPGRRSNAVSLARSDGSASLLSLSVDPDAIAPRLELLDLGVPASVDRPPDELLAFVVGTGVALVEGRHVLGELDAMVLAGDDPTSVRIEQLSEEAVSMALARLRPCGSGSLAWVP